MMEFVHKANRAQTVLWNLSLSCRIFVVQLKNRTTTCETEWRDDVCVAETQDGIRDEWRGAERHSSRQFGERCGEIYKLSWCDGEWSRRHVLQPVFLRAPPAAPQRQETEELSRHRLDEETRREARQPVTRSQTGRPRSAGHHHLHRHHFSLFFFFWDCEAGSEVCVCWGEGLRGSLPHPGADSPGETGRDSKLWSCGETHLCLPERPGPAVQQAQRGSGEEVQEGIHLRRVSLVSVALLWDWGGRVALHDTQHRVWEILWGLLRGTLQQAEGRDQQVLYDSQRRAAKARQSGGSSQCPMTGRVQTGRA